MTRAQSLLGGLVLVTGLALFSPWTAAIAGVALLGYFRDDVEPLAHRLAHEDSPYLPLGFLLLTGLLACARNNFPADDLLRHVVSYAYGYQHTAMYPDSTLPAFNLYPVFDWTTGWVSQQLSPLASVAAAVLLACGLAAHLLYRLAARGIPAGTDDRYLKITLLMALCLATPLSGRLFLGRPEVLVILWACHALIVSTHRGLLVWCLAGGLAVSGYWLAFIVFPVAWVLPFSLKKRILVISGLTLAHLGFWEWHSAGAYLDAVWAIPRWAANRLITVSETESVFQLFFDPAFFGLASLAAFAQYHQGTRRTAYPVYLVLAMFFVLGMVRYVSALAILLAVLAVPVFRDWQIPRKTGLRLMLIAAPFFVASHIALHSETYPRTPRFELPAGSRVLTEFGQATFALPFFNPGRVQVLPAMELGASSREVQQLVKDLVNGKAACLGWQAEKITHVVESRLMGIPSCAKLVAVQGPWRLWEVQVAHD